MSKEKINVVNSILASLQVFSGAAVLGDIIGVTAFAIFVLFVGAIQVGWSNYTKGLVVDEKKVVALELSSGDVVAGPAATQPSGQSVNVVSAPVNTSEDDLY